MCKVAGRPLGELLCCSSSELRAVKFVSLQSAPALPAKMVHQASSSSSTSASSKQVNLITLPATQTSTSGGLFNATSLQAAGASSASSHHLQQHTTAPPATSNAHHIHSQHHHISLIDANPQAHHPQAHPHQAFARSRPAQVIKSTSPHHQQYLLTQPTQAAAAQTYQAQTSGGRSSGVAESRQQQASAGASHQQQASLARLASSSASASSSTSNASSAINANSALPADASRLDPLDGLSVTLAEGFQEGSFLADSAAATAVTNPSASSNVIGLSAGNYENPELPLQVAGSEQAAITAAGQYITTQTSPAAAPSTSQLMAFNQHPQVMQHANHQHHHQHNLHQQSHLVTYSTPSLVASQPYVTVSEANMNLQPSIQHQSAAAAGQQEHHYHQLASASAKLDQQAAAAGRLNQSHMIVLANTSCE